MHCGVFKQKNAVDRVHCQPGRLVTHDVSASLNPIILLWRWRLKNTWHRQNFTAEGKQISSFGVQTHFLCTCCGKNAKIIWSVEESEDSFRKPCTTSIATARLPPDPHLSEEVVWNSKESLHLRQLLKIPALASPSQRDTGRGQKARCKLGAAPDGNRIRVCSQGVEVHLATAP